jgi:hypothetical protein
MPFQRNDILLAFKHIALSVDLNGTEKQFAVFLIDSFNRKTGRCDPSEETAAFILMRHKRSIVRAGNRLVELRLFRKLRHGGHNHCNHYEPIWEAFRVLEATYKQRRHERSKRFDRTNLSPSECQPSHSDDDKVVTQTSSTNHIQSTYLANPSTKHGRLNDQKGLGKERTQQLSRHNQSTFLLRTQLPSSQEAAQEAAMRRWNKDLMHRFLSSPDFGKIVDMVDNDLRDAATKAEMNRKGAGVCLIVEEFARRTLSMNPQGTQESKF